MEPLVRSTFKPSDFSTSGQGRVTWPLQDCLDTLRPKGGASTPRIGEVRTYEDGGLHDFAQPSVSNQSRCGLSEGELKPELDLAWGIRRIERPEARVCRLTEVDCVVIILEVY